VIVGVDPEDIAVLIGHGIPRGGAALRSSKHNQKMVFRADPEKWGPKSNRA
jgi:hypothetical protein